MKKLFANSLIFARLITQALVGPKVNKTQNLILTPILSVPTKQDRVLGFFMGNYYENS